MYVFNFKSVHLFTIDYAFLGAQWECLKGSLSLLKLTEKKRNSDKMGSSV